MDYTSEQYALMERLESGLLYQNLTEKEQEILRYLDESSITQPRAYIEDGYYELSQEGQRTLDAHRQEQLSLQQQSQEKARDKAEQKADKHSDRVFQVFLVFLGYALGLITPSLLKVVPVIWSHICRIVASWK